MFLQESLFLQFKFDNWILMSYVILFAFLVVFQLFGYRFDNNFFKRIVLFLFISGTFWFIEYLFGFTICLIFWRIFIILRRCFFFLFCLFDLLSLSLICLQVRIILMIVNIKRKVVQSDRYRSLYFIVFILVLCYFYWVI